MFKTIKRIIDWCGEFKGRLYAGFVFSFFGQWFTAAPVLLAAYTVGMLLSDEKFDRKWIWLSFIILLVLVALRFLFSYLQARFQEDISYRLVARDRLAIGDALKRVSLGYFQEKNAGDILSSITTGLGTLENMGIRMVDNFVGGYLNFIVIFLFLLFIEPTVSLIALGAALISFVFLLLVSKHSADNAPEETKINHELTAATLEYARGLSVVKSFGQSGASIDAMKRAIADSCRIRLKIEWGFTPANCLHLLALKFGSVALALAACFLGLSGQMEFEFMLVFIFFSFHIFASLEPISDSAHVLSVIDEAMDQLDSLKEKHFIDIDGKDIPLQNFDIEFKNVDFGYTSKQVLTNVTFRIPEKTSAAIIGPSGSGKTTICNLLARFYDVNGGSITIGGHDLREFTCDSLLKNISMVFQNVYLFHDTVRANILFGCPNATEEQMIDVAKKARCHDFIMSLTNGYDTVIGEGGNTLSGGEKQRISIARVMLKNAPIVILDEATASIDPENEHLIQEAISALTFGKTIITIAHRLPTIENADQILVLNNGTIVQNGTHRQLIEQEGLYREFVKIRQQAESWQI